ncbi:helix-turn-helix domain-containing protein [Alteribacillus sp. HJP-4]|uniref:helix-turn-helix domain-containing protein n=1 Tax=Alteribacillus sp. HJP-4 TaxID=2775394 RepID=UPI0035CD070F
MAIEIGAKLKDLREYYNVSQRELAKDICSQKMISKIERGESQPTAEILYEIAIRLGVEITYFFADNEAPRFNYVEETKQKIEELVTATEYQEAVNIVKQELKNPLFRKPMHTKFLLWKRAICHFHLTDEKHEALELIELAMDIETNSKKTITLTDIELNITLGIMHSDLKDFDSAIIYYQKARRMIEKLPKLSTNSQLVKLHYNLSLTQFRMQIYKESIEVASQGIELCIKTDSTFLLGNLYYQKGVSLYYDDNSREGLQYMKKAIYLFEEKDQQVFKEFVEANFLRYQRLAVGKAIS